MKNKQSTFFGRPTGLPVDFLGFMGLLTPATFGGRPLRFPVTAPPKAASKTAALGGLPLGLGMSGMSTAPEPSLA